MWKITNLKNKAQLRHFDKGIIEPFFLVLLELSKMTAKGQIQFLPSTSKAWEHSAIYQKHKYKDILAYVFKKKKKPNRVDFLINDIILKYTTVEIQSVFDLYKSENRKVYSGDYNFQASIIPEEFRVIFVKFFYEELFSNNKIWTALTGNIFTRENFHRNLKEENAILVCPYCDIDTTITSSNNIIEHFLPKNKYPLVSVNPYNLISSCSACNLGPQGKGDQITQPIDSPFNCEIGDFVNFKIQLVARSVLISSPDQNVQNYLNTLKIGQKYLEPRVFDQVKYYGEVFYNSMKKQTSPSKDEVNDYILCRRKKEPLTFALKSLLREFPEYSLLS